MTQASGVLMVGAPKRNSFGADVAANFTEAEKYIQTRKPAILVFGLMATQAEDIDEFCEAVNRFSPDTAWILCCQGLAPSRIVQWNLSGKIRDLVDDFDDPTREGKLSSALVAAGEKEQTRK